MPNFLIISTLFGAAFFAVFTVSLIVDRHRSAIGRWLTFASAISSAWFLLQALYYLELSSWIGINGLWTVEVFRNLAWFTMFLNLLGAGWQQTSNTAVLTRTRGLIACLSLMALSTLLVGQFELFNVRQATLSKLIFAALLAFAVLGLTLIEQLYRNTSPERRWAIKYFCLGVGAIYAYDFVLYADGVLFNRIDPSLWAGRGAANALAVPLIAISAARNREWKLNLFVSRQIVFHSTALLGVGVYLLAMAGAGYYLRAYGGEWGNALRIVFLFAGLVLLISIIGSAGVRSRLRLFLSKHFYRNKYDYGEVWLSFTNRLSQSDTNPEELRRTMLRAIADIMDATGGVMWQRSVTDAYGVVATWEIDPQRLQNIPESHALITVLTEANQVIAIREEAEQATIDGQARVPTWLLELPRAWLLMPIIHGDELLAIVLLCEARAAQQLSWEDRTLLGILGRQAAGYLALVHATEELGNARQFEAFNRLSAFLVHDLKNVIAQLSLVIRNSERHRGNPEFISDAFNTIGDAVAKMNRMLGNLKHTQAGPSDLLSVRPCVLEAIAHVMQRVPIPELEAAVGNLQVLGNRDRFIAMLEHLLQNAQEATSANGKVVVRVGVRDDRVTIEIADNGCGMTQDFVQNRLFKPFDTTKGKGGMGIGVYESLHVASSMGGRLTVDSSPGNGTIFRISLPAVDEVSATELAEIQEKSA